MRMTIVNVRLCQKFSSQHGKEVFENKEQDFGVHSMVTLTLLLCALEDFCNVVKTKSVQMKCYLKTTGWPPFEMFLINMCYKLAKMSKLKEDLISEDDYFIMFD